MRATRWYIIALPVVLASSSGLAQTIETPQARTAYVKAVALRDDFERSHGRFVAVNGIRMHYAVELLGRVRRRRG